MSRNTRNLLIGCGVLVVMCCVCTVGGIVATGGAILNLGVNLFTEIVEGPYQIANRPLPAGPTDAELLPVVVGPFERGQAVPSADGWRVTYSGSGFTVTVRAMQYATTNEAQNAVRAVATQTENAGYSERSSMTGFDPSSVRVVGGAEARMAYSRGPYFFDVQTSSEAALDLFMEAFPY